MKTKEYAIVDIETTGGNASGSRITEIAILIHDGTQVIQRWETLVNPQQDIPLPIFALTGIDNQMVRNAPIFDDIAPEVYALLNNRIFVAHNVNFDYSFVRHQLEESGFKWVAPKLCTVRAARKICPGILSYSLGNLCQSLNIQIENRHRAGGDAEATAILFSRLLEWDSQGIIAGMVKKTATDQRLPPNLPPADFEQLPEKPGVYYFYDQYHKVVYVGKALNLKKRVASHFTGHSISPQRQHFLRDIHGISFEVCATELMALLLECSEIQKLWPPYNKALKRFEAKYGLYTYQARNGYQYLAVGKVAKSQLCLEYFSSAHEAILMLRNLASQFEIDHRFCQYGSAQQEIFFQAANPEPLPELDTHNNRVDNALASLSANRQSFAIIDKGRTPSERSCIWVEAGHFYAMGYIPTDTGFTDMAALKDYLVRYKSNQYLNQLVQGFAEKNPGKVLFLKNGQEVA